MFFDGTSQAGPNGNMVAGVGIILVSPDNLVIHYAYSLKEPCSNNVAEYNALVMGLQLTRQIGADYLEAYGDSKLIVNQI